MSSAAPADPAGLGRRRLTRWLPVLWQAPAEPPEVRPFDLDGVTSPTRLLLRVITSAKRLTLPALGLAVVWQLGEALVPIVTGLAIDRALATGDAGQLLLWAAVLALVFVSLSLGYRFAAQLTARATQLVQHRLRVTLSRAVLHTETPSARPDGGVVSLLTNDVTRTAMVGLTVYPVAELVGVAFIAVALLVIDWPLGSAVLVGAPLTVLALGRLSRRLAGDSRVYQSLLADTVGRATDLMAGYRVIKGIRAEAEAARRYTEASRRALTGAVRNAGVLGRFLVSSGTVSGVFAAGVAAGAAWSAVAGRLTVWLQRHLYDAGVVHWYDVVCTLVYSSHFLVTPLLAAALWLRRRELWLAFSTRVVVLSAAGLVTYCLFPQAPPWYAAREGFTDPVARLSARGWIPLHLGDVSQTLESAQRDGANPVAAMPSLHTAFAVLVAITALTRLRTRWRWLALLYPVAMGFTLVYTGEHYVLDLVVGAVYALAVHLVLCRWEARRAARRANRRSAEPVPASVAA